VDVDAGFAPPTDETDRNHMTRLLQMVPAGEHGVCPESGDEGGDFNLSDKDHCVQIISDSNNFTRH
jgi:hypothetical protein